MDKRVLKKFTLYFCSFKLLFTLCTPALFAQSNFENRMNAISNQLETLSGTEAGLNEISSFSLVDASIQDFLRGLAEMHHLNISIDSDINARVTNNFSNVNVKDLLIFLCRQYRLDIRFDKNIISFSTYKEPSAPIAVYKPKQIIIDYNRSSDQLSVDLKNDSLSQFARQLTSVTNKNIIISPGVGEKLLNGFVKDMPFDKALEKLAFSQGIGVRKTEDGFYILESADAEILDPKSKDKKKAKPIVPAGIGMNSGAQEASIDVDFLVINRDTLLTIDAINAPVSEIIKQSASLIKKNFLFFSDPPGNATVYLRNISFDQLLANLLQSNTHTFRYESGVFLIGNRTSEGFRNTKLVRLDFRTIEEIEKSMPAELLKGVELKVFKELNGVILSGGKIQIEEIAAILHQLDQPVPNILIEVIVAEFRKGYSIQTGLKAFLSDSVPATGGQLFPGLDMTLSSGSINNALGKLDDKGIVNLGRVTPKFYVQLQALEDNNFLNLRSTPKLSTLNGHEANLVIGQSRYYLEQTQNISGGVSPITSLSQRWQKVEANLSIKINPVVSGDEHITLSIEAEFSDFVEPIVKGAPPGSATRKFISQIRIRNEEMIVLGGLEEAKNQNSKSGFPILSRIPILNYIFSSRSTVKNDSQLIIFIKPTIVY